MRGDKEKHCLNFIKKYIFTNNGMPIDHPFTNKKYTEVDDEEFVEEQMWFINDKCHKNYFGLLEKDRNEIEQILRLAKSNINTNEFPDFVFENGYIEHFQVSSSKTTRKGAEHIKKLNNFVAKVNKETEILKLEWSERPSYANVRSKQWIMDNPVHSHDFLIKSFKENWENHLNSLNKYTGKRDVGIFLIEYSDWALSMIENVYEGWIEGMSHGDMREQEKCHCYRLTRDKTLLDYIYNYKDIIKYVIFVYSNDFEIIRLENIPHILKLFPWEYKICPNIGKNISSVYNISIPNI